MNKYQEVLNVLGMIILDSSSNGYDSPKYLKDFYPKEIETLQELINRVKIVKPIKVHNNVLGTNESYITYECPNCNKVVGFDRNDKVPTSIYARDEWCDSCGALMDWSDDEDE